MRRYLYQSVKSTNSLFINTSVGSFEERRFVAPNCCLPFDSQPALFESLLIPEVKVCFMTLVLIFDKQMTNSAYQIIHRTMSVYYSEFVLNYDHQGLRTRLSTNQMLHMRANTNVNKQNNSEVLHCRQW